MNAEHARGACLLRAGRLDEARASFQQALELYPEHAPSYIGLALASPDMTSRGPAEKHTSSAFGTVRGILMHLREVRPIEAALVESQLLISEGRADDPSAILCRMLDSAPPGFAGWTIPIEPLLVQLHATKGFRAVLQRLADRAR